MLEQLPWRVFETRGSCASPVYRNRTYGIVEVDVGFIPVEEPFKMSTQRVAHDAAYYA